jgi:acid phosphatase family membrane protein YuiD
MIFLSIPITAWVFCGSIKFALNAFRYGSEAMERIGHGGFPSNHTAIISSLVWSLSLVGEWRMAGLALAVLMTHIFDATGLRREIGRHAEAINQLTAKKLREIIGHKPADIAGGLVVGLIVAAGYWWFGVLD